MEYCAFRHTPLTVWQALSNFYADMRLPVKNETYKIEQVFAVRHLANYFELPESTATYLLDLLIVEGHVKVRSEGGRFYVFVPTVK